MGYGTGRTPLHVPHVTNPFLSSPRPFYSSNSIAAATAASTSTYLHHHHRHLSSHGDNLAEPVPLPPPPPLWVLTERLLSFYKCRSHRWNVQCSVKKMLVASVVAPRDQEHHAEERGRGRLEELLRVWAEDYENTAAVNLMDVFLTAPPLVPSGAPMSSTVIKSNYFTKNVFVSEVNACLAKKLETLKRIGEGSPPQRDGVGGNVTPRINEELIDLAEHDEQHELVFSDEKTVFELLYEVPYEIAMAKKDSEMLGVMSASVSSAPLPTLLGSSSGVSERREIENASSNYRDGGELNCDTAPYCATSQWKNKYFRGASCVVKGKERDDEEERSSSFHHQQQSVLLASSIIRENFAMHGELCFRMEESERDALAFHLGYPSLLTQHPSSQPSSHEELRRGITSIPSSSSSFGAVRDLNNGEEEEDNNSNGVRTNRQKDSSGLSAAADCARGHFTTDPTFYLNEYNNNKTKNATRETQKPVVTLLVFEKFMASQCDVFIKYMFASMVRATGGVLVVGGGVDTLGGEGSTAAVHWIVAVTALQWLSDTLTRILPPTPLPSSGGCGRNGKSHSELLDGEVKRGSQRGEDSDDRAFFLNSAMLLSGEEDRCWSNGASLSSTQFDGNSARRRIREAFADKGGARNSTTPPVSEGSFIAMVLMCVKEVIKRHRHRSLSTGTNDRTRTRTTSSTKHADNHLQQSDRYGLVQTPRSGYYTRGGGGEKKGSLWGREKEERGTFRASEYSALKTRRGHHPPQKARHLISDLYIFYRVLRHAVIPMWASDFAPWIYHVVRDDNHHHDALRRGNQVHVADDNRTKDKNHNDDDDGCAGVGAKKSLAMSSPSSASSSSLSSYSYLLALRRRCDSVVDNLLFSTTVASLHAVASQFPSTSPSHSIQLQPPHLNARHKLFLLLLPYPIPLFIRPLLLEAALRGVVRVAYSTLSSPSAADYGLGATAFASPEELYEQLRSLPYDTTTARGGGTSSSSIFKNETTRQQQQSGDRYALENILRRLQGGDASGKGASSSPLLLPSLRPSAAVCCGTVSDYVDVFLNCIASEMMITTTIDCTSSSSLSHPRGRSSFSNAEFSLSVEAAVRHAAERWSRYAVGERTRTDFALTEEGPYLLSIDDAAAFIIDTFPEISSSCPRHAVVEALLATLGLMLAAEGRTKAAPAVETKMMTSSHTLFADDDDACKGKLINSLYYRSLKVGRAQAVNGALEFGARKLFTSLSAFHPAEEEGTDISTATKSSINSYYPPRGTMRGENKRNNDTTNRLDDETSSYMFLLEFIELCIEAIDPSKSTTATAAAEGSRAAIVTQRGNSLASLLATDLRVSLADVIACVLVWSELGVEVGIGKEDGNKNSGRGNHDDKRRESRSLFPYTRRQVALAFCGMLLSPV